MTDDVYRFRTIQDLRAIPAEKIDALCEDLRLWLHHMRHAETFAAAESNDLVNVVVTSPMDEFQWIDDGKHEVTTRFELAPELYDAVVAAGAPLPSGVTIARLEKNAAEGPADA